MKYYLEAIINKHQDAEIRWSKPNFNQELNEYFDNEYTQKAFKEKNITFDNEKDLLKFLSNGSFQEFSQQDIQKLADEGKIDNVTMETKYFNKEKSDKNYRQSFNKMKSKLQKGSVTLPSPTLIKFKDGTYYGYAGNRRSNLAYNHNLPVKFWVVNA